MNIPKLVTVVKNLDQKSNHNQLKIFELMQKIFDSEAWKKPENYDGAPELIHFTDATFDNFLQEIFGYTSRWFFTMKKITSMKMGRHLFLRYGKPNMVTYINSTPDERRVILEEVEKSVKTATFASIKARKFPRKKRPVSSIDYKARYERLKKEMDGLKKQHEKEIETLANKFRTEMATVKKAYAILTSDEKVA